jgi:predicted dehydrogenase/nucleoside-diphosphate-sugar epimerase
MGNADKPVRVAFLGTGYIADWHAKALRTIPGVELAAVCDKDIARARAFGEKYGVAECWPSLEAMLAKRELGLDAIHVLLPPDLHAGAACAIIDAGLHVLMEKPMAVSAEQCTELLDRAQAREVKIGVNHNFLFAPVYESLHNDLTAGKLGRPDHLRITWNRGLDQLQFGPYNLWMLRDPGNIILEIGSHSVASMLDLVGPLELTSVRVSNPVDLPGGCRFYRRWQVGAGTGATAVTLEFSFAPGFTEQMIHIRGSLASATVDFERNTYTLHRHTKYGLDYDRFRMILDEAAGLRTQARRGFNHYVLSKLKLSNQGSPYGLSIARAMQSFYAQIRESTDPRLAPELGRDVVELCNKISRSTGLETAAPAAEDVPSAKTASPASAVTGAESKVHPEILVLGATGFIGQELARQLLAGGHALRVLVRDPGRLPVDLHDPRVDVSVGNLCRSADLERALEGIQYVYHLARANVKTWEEFTRQDIEVTRQVALTCLARNVKRLIYTGTIDSYYAGKKAGIITEVTPLDPQIAWRNLYARAKAASEEILLALYRERGLSVVIFRPGIVVGRGGSPFHWGIGMWSWNSVCQVWGQGSNPLPLVLVEDVASALVAGLKAEGIEGESFNLIADSSISARDYLNALEEGAGVSFQIISTPPWKFYAIDLMKWVVKQAVRHPDRRRPSLRDWESRTQRARYDSSKARQRLNWRPIDDRYELIRRGIHLPASEFLA